MTEEVTNPDLRSQDERQLDLISDLNSRVPSNPQGDAADAGLKKILQSLSKNSLSDALRDSFSADKLKCSLNSLGITVNQNPFFGSLFGTKYPFVRGNLIKPIICVFPSTKLNFLAV